MGKKSTGKTYVSAGLVGVDKKISNKIRAEHMHNGDRALAQRAAWKAGKNVVLTLPNGNTKETNKPFIKVPAKQVWGDPRDSSRRPAPVA